MGAIKFNNYTENDQELSLTARAFAHPARIKIIKMMLSGQAYKNIDLCSELNFSKKTVKAHIDVFKDANLVKIDYFMHYYLVSLNERGKRKADNFLNVD